VKALEVAGALLEVETKDGYKVLEAVRGTVLPALGPRTAGPEDEITVERLRAWRLERSRADEVPAFVVLHDATLRELAAVRPSSMGELATVKGLGPAKLERYGDDLLALLTPL
jgi:superfamily II DNA helicase RecQ